MMTFMIVAVLLIALVLLWLLQPYYRKPSASTASRSEMNIGIYREQLARVEQDLADGLLDADQAKASTAEIQARLLQETVDESAPLKPHASRLTVILTAILVPLTALGLYAMLGNPIQIAQDGRSDRPGGAQNVQRADIERMVEGLAAKLEKDPGNQQGWAMLARSYKVLGRMADAEKAYDRAGSLVTNDAQLLADYADAAAANANGNFSGKPMRLIERALSVDPQNPMALWLAGSAALQANDKPKAIVYMQRLLKVLPPDSEDAQIIREAIDKLKGS